MNYEVIAQSGLKVRGGPGADFKEVADRLVFGDIVIGADKDSPDPAWLPIILEDEEGEESLGWVSRQYVREDNTDYRVQEIVKINQPSPVVSGVPIFQKDLARKYGNPREGAPYLKIIDLREFSNALDHVRDFQGNRWSCRIYGHEAMEGPLKNAFRLLVGRNLAGDLKTYDGCHCIRKMTSGRNYSVHSWGLAIDLNARWNPYGGEVQFSDDLILCFADAGFEGGALWSTPDGMHFQLPWTQDWRNSDHPLRPRI